uniref:Uncharacterized protein OJ1341F06.20 n=2 Tax=Oryza TaxID=4527 RepID=Q8S5C4_ORYSJ|nr:Hypothetical protein [Oryza sativa Japonica Group]AAP53396.1 hypothetical protein LOC_Os10g22680 [Oryza sativa Japonica Group]
MGDAAVMKVDTGGTSRSARQTALLHLKPEPKPICQTRWPRRTRPLASASITFVRVVTSMPGARAMAGGGGGGASQMQPSSSLHHSATARGSSSTSAGRRRAGRLGRAWGRRSQRGGGPEQDEDGGGRGGDSSGRRWRLEVLTVMVAKRQWRAGGARAGDVAARGGSGRAWQRLWRGGREVKEVAGGGGEWPDGRPFFFSDVA